MSNAPDILAMALAALGLGQAPAEGYAELQKAMAKGTIELRTGTGSVTIQTVVAGNVDAEAVQARLEAGESIEDIMAERRAQLAELKAINDTLPAGCGDPSCTACQAREAMVEGGSLGAIPAPVLDDLFRKILTKMAIDTGTRDVLKSIDFLKQKDREERTRTIERIAKARVAGMTVPAEDELTMKLLNLRLEVFNSTVDALIASAQAVSGSNQETRTPPEVAAVPQGSALH